MDTVLRNLVGMECSIFVDDFLVFSTSAEEHDRRLENVFRGSEEANLLLHPREMCLCPVPSAISRLYFVWKWNFTLPRERESSAKLPDTYEC
jgi:hypothetical protein